MTLLKVKTKYQVTLPTEARTILGVKEGDILGVVVESGRIILTPKAVIDKRLAEGLADIAAGKVHGPYKSVKAMMASLHQNAD